MAPSSSTIKSRRRRKSCTSLSKFPPLFPQLLLEIGVRPALVVKVDAVADDGCTDDADTQGRSAHHNVSKVAKVEKAEELAENKGPHTHSHRK